MSRLLESAKNEKRTFCSSVEGQARPIIGRQDSKKTAGVQNQNSLSDQERKETTALGQASGRN